MQPKPEHHSAIDKAISCHATFRLAEIAVGDVISGSCRALVIAKRAESMGLPSSRELLDTVSDVYSRPTGRVPDHLHPWSCGECGSVYQAYDEALDCCSYEGDSW